MARSSSNIRVALDLVRPRSLRGQRPSYVGMNFCRRPRGRRLPILAAGGLRRCCCRGSVRPLLFSYSKLASQGHSDKQVRANHSGRLKGVSNLNDRAPRTAPPPGSEMPPAAALLGRRLLGFDSDNGTATFEFFAKPDFANRHGTVQGGMLCAMLDSATGATLVECLPAELTAVTTRLTTSFVMPAPIGWLKALTRIVAKDDKNAEVEAEIATSEGVVVARGTAVLRIRRRN